jgi:hypothetical protein
MKNLANKILLIFLLITFFISSIITASSWALDPVPDIKANGSDGPVTISSGDPFTLTVQLNAGSMSGENADWWGGVNIASTPPADWYHYDLASGWMPGKTTTYQGPLFNLNPYSVSGISGLPVGTYTFYFAVDLIMNGSLDMDQIYYDSVQVSVTEGGFFEDFDDGVADNWTDDGSGRWSVAKGLYTMTGDNSGFARSYYNEEFTDITYELDMMRSVGDPEEKTMGIMVRTSNILNSNRNGYRFSMIPIGWWGIAKYVNGSFITIISSQNNPSPAINTGLGAWNHLKVECNGSQFSYYINGVHLATINDNDFASGDVAIIYYEEAGEVNHVDNVMVTIGVEAPLSQKPLTTPTYSNDKVFDEEFGIPK